MPASFPMYDRPELRAATDALWQSVRAALGRGPDRLDRATGLLESWRAPDLLLSQCCALPLRIDLTGAAQIVGWPDYDLPGVPPGHYNSALVAHTDDSRGLAELMRARVAINQWHSESGWGAIWRHAGARGWQPNVTRETGAHVATARLIAEGEIDLAAIDCHSLRLIRRHDPWANALREIERTMPTPAPAFITGPEEDPDEIFAALEAGLAALDDMHRKALSLRAVVPAGAVDLNAPSLPERPPISAAHAQ